MAQNTWHIYNFNTFIEVIMGEKPQFFVKFELVEVKNQFKTNSVRST